MADGHPKIAPGIEINAVSDGYVVHDNVRNRIHYLNQTSAVVLELCTGEIAEDELAELVRVAYELSTAPVAEVAECLATLRREGLVV